MSTNPTDNSGLQLGGLTLGGLTFGGGELAQTMQQQNKENENSSTVEKTSLFVGMPTTTVTNPGYGQQHVQASLKSGMLSVQDDVSRRSAANEIIKKCLADVMKAREEIDQSIQDFRQSSSEGNQAFKLVALEQIKQLTSKQEFTQSDLNRVDAASQLAKIIALRFFETSTQLMDLQKMNASGKFDALGEVIQMAFDYRMKEIGLMRERLKTLRVQEEHEIDMETKVRNQQLKEQSQQFDMLMQAVKFDNEKEQQNFNAHLEERKLHYLQEKDLVELGIQNKKVEGGLKLEGIKTGNEKEIEEKKIASNEKVEKLRIAAKTTTEVTKIVAEVAKPKCTIQ